MRKGFIFTTDAVLALIIVMAVGVLFAVYFQATEPRAEAYAASERVSSDSAIVGLYLDKGAIDMGLAENIQSIPGNPSYASCNVNYKYNDTAVNKLDERKYCRGI